MIRTLAAALLPLAVPLAQAGGTGQFLTTVWQTSEGMPHNSPTAVLQDRLGYLWVATHSGLARFDGARFEHFTAADGLPDNRVLSLAEDRQGAVWAGTDKGVAVRRNGAWQAHGDPWPQTQIWEMAAAGDGALWLGGDSHAFRCHHGSVQRIAANDSGVRHLLADGAGGAMWLLYRDSLHRWEAGTAALDRDFARVAAGRELWRLARDGNGTLWASGTGLLARKDADGGAWQEVTGGMPDADGSHIRLLAARDGTLWVATRNRGLSFLRDGAWRTMGVDDGLSHEDVRDLLQDREGNLWVCTNGGGLNRLIEQRLEVFGRSRGLGRHVTTALALDPQGTLWAGTDGGGVLKLKHPNFVPGLPRGALGDGYVWSIAAAPGGGLWIGTFRDGLLHWRDGDVRWLRDSDGLLHNWITSLLLAADGMLWVGSHYGGVQLWDGHELRTLHGTKDKRGSAILGFLETPDGDVWAATAGDGLYRWRDGAMKRFTRADGLPGDIITTLHRDDAGKLWIGTAGAGLAAWRQTTDDFVFWTTAQGLHHNSIQQIQSDADGTLWLGTENGLQRLEPAALPTPGTTSATALRGTVFSRPDGLPTPQFSSGHGNLSLRAPDGALWFSLAAGAVRVVPAAFDDSDQPLPPAHIEALQAGQREVWHFERTANGARPTPIPPGARDVGVRFTAAWLGAPERLRLRYRLVGFDDGWRTADAGRLAIFPSLPPGHYRFEVSAADETGQWSGRPATLEFELRPWFWETTWFRGLAALAAIAAVIAVVRYLSLRRLHRKMRLLEQEQRLEKERSRIAGDLHDDLGATLTEINFLGSLGLGAAQSPATRERLEGIVERARRMAKSLDEIVWTVNPANDTLTSTVSYLCSHTRESLTAAAISCHFEVDESFPVIGLDSERRHHLLMAVSEAVNNIMKHSGSTTAMLRAGWRAGRLEVVLEDHGRGFDPGALPPGRNGLANMRRRMEAARGSLVIDSRPGGGTRVRLVLPLAAIP